MKKLLLCTISCIPISLLNAQSITDTTYLPPVEVQAVRASEKAPFAKTDLTKKEIEKNNIGQDLPFILNQTPSVVVGSDAGTGVGYTGIRIRGVDATRINVTLNGIPYNDAESQGTFFVDLPDFSSSASSMQVQRGVGTSSNGSGAFGSTINLSTNEKLKDFSVALNNSIGSFNTRKSTMQFSGFKMGNLSFDGRLSNIRSDGYIDRASSDLRSAFGSLLYEKNNNSIRLNVFSGKEKTYQAWNGVPEYLLDSNRTYNSSGTEKQGAPYGNEIDHYLQTHYQLFFNHSFNKDLKAHIAFFVSKGRGYYEEYRADQSYADYGLPDYTDTALHTSTDIVRRLWLDNDFYGSIFSIQYQQPKDQLIIGGGYNGYDGKHFGEIIWAKVTGSVPSNYHWYDLTAYKKDLSVYGKWSHQWSADWSSFVDLQGRKVIYNIYGFRYNPTLVIKQNNFFFNPKIGITYLKNNFKAYASIAVASKEPIRDDYEAGVNQQPTPEHLYDLEAGIEKKASKYSYGAGLYYMLYKDQLVLTGKINDVGAYTRTNIPNSFRAGIELQGSAVLNKKFNVAGNISFTQNKIKNFTEYIDDYDNGGQQTKFYSKTDISFSPSVVGAATINIIPIENATISLLEKYVSRQFLDNTSNRSRSLDPYFTQDVDLRYKWIPKKTAKEIVFFVRINNIFNMKYEPNGYSFSYIYGGQLNTENFYYPMAGMNFIAGINIKL